MNTIRILAALAALACCESQLRANETFIFGNLNEPIPDGRPAGMADFQTISSRIGPIGSITVTLNISGNFNGDLYGYLRHNNALAVLLNRPGRTAGNAYGYDDCGFQVTLSDSAPNGDIHNYQGVVTPPPNLPLTGLWQPDGRASSPATVLDTDPRTAGLSVFNTQDASGTWTLFLADLSLGGTSVLSSWQLDIAPVPEPSMWALILAGVGAGVAIKRRRAAPRFTL